MRPLFACVMALASLVSATPARADLPHRPLARRTLATTAPRGLAPAVPAAPRRLAQAPAAASCTVTEIRGSAEGKGIDARLKRLEPKLRKAFTAWDTFAFVGEQQVAAAQNKTATARLANGGTLSLLLKSVVAPGRFRLEITIDDKTGSRIVGSTFTIDAGDPLLVSGEPDAKNAVYILALTCR